MLVLLLDCRGILRPQLRFKGIQRLHVLIDHLRVFPYQLPRLRFGLLFIPDHFVPPPTPPSPFSFLWFTLLDFFFYFPLILILPTHFFSPLSGSYALLTFLPCLHVCFVVVFIHTTFFPFLSPCLASSLSIYPSTPFLSSLPLFVGSPKDRSPSATSFQPIFPMPLNPFSLLVPLVPPLLLMSQSNPAFKTSLVTPSHPQSSIHKSSPFVQSTFFLH